MLGRFRAFVLSFFALLAVASCSMDEGAPLRVGTNQWVGYEPLYLAESLNHFHKWDIRLVQLPSATDVIHALTNHRLEAACLTLDEALTVVSQGTDLKIILIMDVSNGADALVAAPHIDSLAALRGKRIGVENTAVGAVLLDGALEAAGLAVGDIQVVPLTADNHARAFLAGTVDAVVTFDPIRARLLRSGAKVLFDSSQIPCRIVDVLVVRSEVVEVQGDHLHKLLEGYFKARVYMRSNPLEAAALMAPRLQETPESLLAAYEGLTLPTLDENRALLQHGGRLTKVTEELYSLMARQKLIADDGISVNLGSDAFLPAGPK